MYRILITDEDGKYVIDETREVFLYASQEPDSDSWKVTMKGVMNKYGPDLMRKYGPQIFQSVGNVFGFGRK